MANLMLPPSHEREGEFTPASHASPNGLRNPWIIFDLWTEETDTAVTSDARATLRRALLALRLAIALFILCWGMAGLEGAARGQVLFARLPGAELSPGMATLLAIAQVTLGAFVMLGLFKSLSYGLALFTYAVATFASHQALFVSLDRADVFALTTLPLLVAVGLLFALRDQDTMLSIDVLARRRRYLTKSQSSMTNPSSPVV